MKFHVNPKENIYLTLMSITSVCFYGALIAAVLGSAPTTPSLIIMACYTGAWLLLQTVGQLFFIGYLRCNAIRITPNQLPEIFNVLLEQSQKLGLKRLPTLYVLQGNGVLNAFATKFARKNYVVILSSVLEAAYNEGMHAVEFIIGHELGHIKQNHIGFFKSVFLFPGKLIPFMGAAYSRACEYTCDNIGHMLAPTGAQQGLTILGAGAHLYKKINITELISNARADRGFATYVTELFSTHPDLAKRLESLSLLGTNPQFKAYAAQATTFNETGIQTASPITTFEPAIKEPSQNPPSWQ